MIPLVKRVSSCLLASKGTLVRQLSISAMISGSHKGSSTVGDQQQHPSGSNQEIPRKSRTKKVKKELTVAGPPEGFLEVTAYSTTDAIALWPMRSLIPNINGKYQLQQLGEVDNALMFTASENHNGSQNRIFVFDHGCVVFWNVSLSERKSLLDGIWKPTGLPSPSLLELESESMDYVLDKQASKSSVDIDGKITLTAEEKPLDAYAISHAISLSVKLGTWETSLNNFANSVQFVAEDMALEKKLTITRTQVFQKIGQLFKLRHHINLGSDLLDIPDFYWDRQELETLFKNTCNSLNVGRRTRLMNEKLSYCYELMDMLTTHLNEAHNTKLEWMIIILIAVEVVFEVIHFLENKERRSPELEAPLANH